MNAIERKIYGPLCWFNGKFLTPLPHALTTAALLGGVLGYYFGR